MFLNSVSWKSLQDRFPRVRGDVPTFEGFPETPVWFSPRARGCSDIKLNLGTAFNVFPACAGMFRIAPNRALRRVGFPRVRGDVPCAKCWNESAP